jgi:hypothetical protein
VILPKVEVEVGRGLAGSHALVDGITDADHDHSPSGHEQDPPPVLVNLTHFQLPCIGGFTITPDVDSDIDLRQDDAAAPAS